MISFVGLGVVEGVVEGVIEVAALKMYYFYFFNTLLN
jgi:hypothetical protein